jgi:hypothetical protein
MDDFLQSVPKTISVDKDHQHVTYVLFEDQNGPALLKLFSTFGFTCLGKADLPHKKANYFAQLIPTPDRDEHFLCMTKMEGNVSAFLGPGESVLAFCLPRSLYQERQPLFEHYVDLSTAFFTADNRQAHSLVDQADALIANFC